MAETRIVRCKECEREFEIEARIIERGGKTWETTQLNGRTCPKCQEIKKKRVEQRRGARTRMGGRLNDSTVSRKIKDIAKAMGISCKIAEATERRALAKLRENPELKKLFEVWLAEGGEIPVMEFQQDIGDMFIDYMLELSRWYEVLDNLVGRRRQKDALQCRREIEKFHETFKKQLIKMDLIKE